MPTIARRVSPFTPLTRTSRRPAVRPPTLLISACLLSGLLAGCVGTELPPSLWPPDDFVIELEELRFEAESAHVLRRFRVDATGLALYGESASPLVDTVSGVSLPVFDRLSVYRLELECVRALSRRLSRLATPDVVGARGRAGADAEVGLVLRWRAFRSEERLTGAGRLSGTISELVALVAAHLPPGASLQTDLGRRVVPVLRGAPEALQSVDGALSVYRELRDGGVRGGGAIDADFLLEGFALASRRGDRGDAEQWLEAWATATAAARANVPAFADEFESLQPAQLRELLPPSSLL